MINKVRASKELRRKVGIANKRLKRLEETGYDYYAYDIAKHYIKYALDGVEYYSTKGIDTKFELSRLERSVDTFLESKSSTVRGQRAIERARIKVFEEKGLIGTYEQKKEFLRFLGEDGYKNLTDTIGYDASLFKEIVGNYNYYRDTQRIEKILLAYQRSRANYAETTERLRKRYKSRKWKG